MPSTAVTLEVGKIVHSIACQLRNCCAKIVNVHCHLQQVTLQLQNILTDIT